MERLILVIVEAAIELVPKRIQDHPAVRIYAAKRGKKPGEVLLDRSYHHAAMKKLQEAEKRGRPDITHFILLEALGSPLNKFRMLDLYVQTRSGHVIWMNPETRLPRVYERFKGLIEKLYKDLIIKADDKILMRLEKKSIENLIKEVNPDLRILLSEEGKLMKWNELGEILISKQRPLIMIGGFPRGRFREETIKNADEVISIWPEPLEAWVVSSKILSITEQALRIWEKPR